MSVRGEKDLIVRLAGLPLTFAHRVSVVRKSIRKHTLHGCQTAGVPKTVHTKLRTKLCRGLRVDRAGRSPWLVSNVLTAEPIDPEWTVLVERFRLCQQLARTCRECCSFANPLLLGNRGRYKGVTRRFNWPLWDGPMTETSILRMGGGVGFTLWITFGTFFFDPSYIFLIVPEYLFIPIIFFWSLALNFPGCKWLCMRSKLAYESVRLKI